MDVITDFWQITFVRGAILPYLLSKSCGHCIWQSPHSQGTDVRVRITWSPPDTIIIIISWRRAKLRIGVLRRDMPSVIGNRNSKNWNRNRTRSPRVMGGESPGWNQLSQSEEKAPNWVRDSDHTRRHLSESEWEWKCEWESIGFRRPTISRAFVWRGGLKIASSVFETLKRKPRDNSERLHRYI